MTEQQETDIFEGYLSREQLAEKLGVTTNTVARWSVARSSTTRTRSANG